MSKAKELKLHFDIKLSLWAAIKLRIAGIEKVITNDNLAKEVFTCFICDNEKNCNYAYAAYNIEGKCLYNKDKEVING